MVRASTVHACAANLALSIEVDVYLPFILGPWDHRTMVIVNQNCLLWV